MENGSNFGWDVAPDSKPHLRAKNYIYSCEKRQGWKWSQLVLWSLLHTKWTMAAILGGVLTPTSTRPQTRGKNFIFIHMKTSKAKISLNLSLGVSYALNS